MLPSPLRRILPLLAAAALVPTASLALAAPGSAATPAAAGAPKACATKARHGHVHPRPRPGLRVAALDQAEGRARQDPLPRHDRRQAPQGDHRAPPQGPRPPGPEAAPQGGDDARAPLRPRPEGDRDVLRPDHAGERGRRDAVETSARLSWARSRNGDGKLTAMTASTSTSRPAPPPTAPR